MKERLILVNFGWRKVVLGVILIVVILSGLVIVQDAYRNAGTPGKCWLELENKERGIFIPVYDIEDKDFGKGRTNCQRLEIICVDAERWINLTCEWYGQTCSCRL